MSISKTERARPDSAGVVSAQSRLSRREAVIVAALTAAVLLLHLWIPGFVPSGADGGNWLAMAVDRGSEEVMSARVVYPPLYIAFLETLMVFLGPVSAVTVSALVAKLSVVLAVYFCLRGVGVAYAAIGAVIVATAGAQTEAYAWGGYPQLLATGPALLCVWFLVRYLRRGARSDLWIAMSSAVFVGSTHLLIGGLLPLALLIGAGMVFLTRRSGQIERKEVAAAIAVPLISAAAFAAQWYRSADAGVEAVLNPLEESRLELAMATIRDAPIPWLVLFLVAGLALTTYRVWPDAIRQTAFTGVAWGLAGLGFFAVTAEPRSLLLSQVGVVLVAGVAARHWLSSSRHGLSAKLSHPLQNPYHAVSVVVAVSLMAALVGGGVDAYVGSTAWYRVVDSEELESLDLLATNSGEESLVVSSGGKNGNPLGWWVEGYAQLPTFTGVDVDVLAFPDERAQARIANSIFSGDLSGDQTRSALDDIGADFLVIDRRGPDASFLGTPFAKSLPVLLDSETLVILRAR